MYAYFFGNMYISPIQHGIQAAHVVTKMFVKYQPPSKEEEKFNSAPHDILMQWADQHVTKILLNAGYASNLERVEELLSYQHNPYPWYAFREEEAALNGAITSVGVVLPTRLCELAKDVRGKPGIYDQLHASQRYPLFRKDGDLEIVDICPFEIKLIQKINSCKLA